jgi:hypothetical protein
MMATMKASADLVATVPSARIYGQTMPANPAFPLVRCGSPSSVPITGACVDGAEARVDVHGFTKPRLNVAGAVVETAEDHAARLGALISSALDHAVFDVPGGKARVRWLGDQLLQDPEEADCFHTVQRFRVRVIAG